MTELSSSPRLRRDGTTLRLNALPAVYILPRGLDVEHLHELEEELIGLGAPLTYDAKEARIFLGRLSQKKRAAFELRQTGLWTEEKIAHETAPPAKRQRLSPIKHNPPVARKITPETESETDADSDPGPSTQNSLVASYSPATLPPESRHPFQQLAEVSDDILVLRLDWLEDSLKRNEILPPEGYVVYDARIVPKPAPALTSTSPIRYIKATPEATSQSHSPMAATPRSTIASTLQQSQNIGPAKGLEKGHPVAHQSRRRFNHSSAALPTLKHPPRPPKLQRTTTSEFEELDTRSLPEPPTWVKEKSPYSCKRSTLLHPPNARFVSELLKIKEARLLTLDEIGVRAYSTSIASIAAYPYRLTSPAEVLRLPGCDTKIATLFQQYRDSAMDEFSRYLQTARDLENDEHLQHLKLFHEIWGVGPDTARKFYFDKGWKDLDDIVEFGWTTLNRVQQIGVKFYDEFQVRIARAEVESINDVILRHARLCRNIPQQDWGTDRDIVAVIVGGYRRGKEESGDVDTILSHRDEDVTEDPVVDVVASLEREGWITHTLTLNTTTSDRGQQTLPFRGQSHGHGFDSLDKAFFVWQDPNFDQSRHAKNPNIHRRVDVIVSAWRTVGCAILGWSGATTFERDIRRWAKKAKGWKFDSSGVRDRMTGVVLDLESPHEGDPGDRWLDRERRLMNGLEIGWREPTERCTG